MFINLSNMDSNNNNVLEKQDDPEKRKMSEVKEKISEKKRTDSRNEYINYHRKRMIQPVQIRQLSQEDVNLDDVFEEENVDYINKKIEDFKPKIINPSSEEELWKSLLIFETMSKKINVRLVLASDLNFIQNLLELTQKDNLSEECKLGTLQMLSEITQSFKNLSEIGQNADQQAFESYLRVFRHAKTEKIVATVLQGMSQLSLDNTKASEYFIQNGLYNEIVVSFEKMLSNPGLYNESIKDICILFHGLSKQKNFFDYSNPKLEVIFRFLIETNDSDIHFDISSAIENIVSSYAKNPNLEWVHLKLQELYNIGLMQVILKLVNQDNVWIPVKGNKIIGVISHIKNDQIRQVFMQQFYESGVFDSILQSIKNVEVMLVLKYHLFLTLKNLITRECITSDKFNYLIQNLVEPQVIEKPQYHDNFFPNKRLQNLKNTIQKIERIQQQVIETIWECIQKGKDQFQLEITKPLIEVLCLVLRDSNDADIVMKCLDIFNRVMHISALDINNQKKHIKWMQSRGFNQIIHNLQQSKNIEISNKAVQVVSYLDSDEEGSDSDSDNHFDKHSMEEEDDDN